MFAESHFYEFSCPFGTPCFHVTLNQRWYACLSTLSAFLDLARAQSSFERLATAFTSFFFFFKLDFGVTTTET